MNRPTPPNRENLLDRDAPHFADTVYRDVIIADSRAAWTAVAAGFDPEQDLVLTFDFGLLREIQDMGGAVAYVDHLCDPAAMQDANFTMYRFFADWHRDTQGNDIFRYHDVDFGLAFRIEIWNDYTFLVRLRLCLERLKLFRYRRLLVASIQPVVMETLEDIGLPYTRLGNPPEAAGVEYYFPVHRWMDERLRSRRWRHVVRDVATMVQGLVMGAVDRIVERFRPKRRVFVQEYHPTRALLQRLLREPGMRVIQAHFSAEKGLRSLWRERPIPVYGDADRWREEATQLLHAFRERRSSRLVFAGGIDVTAAAYRVIERRIEMVLPQMLRGLACAIRYLDRHPLDLEVLIGNLGQLAMLVDCVARSRGVRSYLIVNGFLGADYLDEGKYATVINAYSESVRDHYFRGMDNIVCLGDPRMDAYADVSPRVLDRANPTITIGASGFSPIDLNSYVACEFDFLDEVLTAIRRTAEQGRKFRVIVKVRPNGYKEQYQKFIDEYFSGLVDEVVDAVPIGLVLEKTDFYVSIYSQTLFEASCLGIPCVYHKSDASVMQPPFDGSSELVTTRSVAELVAAISDFLAGNQRFTPFLDRTVMETYIGPLDGRNLERNLDAVRALLRGRDKEARS